MTSSPDGPHGLLVLDKPAGITSHDLVSRTRRALRTRKIGHAGTLDPMATGVMLLGVGDATRLLTYFVGDDKTYSATIRLGATTSTEDAEGELLEVGPAEAVAALDEEAIRAQMTRLTGEISQVPSAVSAIKVDGKRAYQRVRDGEEVELAARPVRIHRFELEDAGQAREAMLPDGSTALVRDLEVEVDCSSGTYIRALARDLGAALGVGAHLTRLRRTRVGAFALDRATTLPEPAAKAPEPNPDVLAALIPPAALAATAFPVWRASADEAPAFRNGRRVEAPERLLAERGPVAVLDASGALIGLVEVRGGLSRTLVNLPQRAAGEAS